MKILRGMVALTVALAVCGAAWAQTTPGAIMPTPGVGVAGGATQAVAMERAQGMVPIAKQVRYVEAMGNMGGFQNIAQSQMQDKLIGATDGTLLPSAVYVSGVDASTRGPVAQANQIMVTNFLNGANQAGTTMTTAETAQAMEIMAATPAQTAVNAAGATVTGLKNVSSSRAAIARGDFASGIRSDSGFANPYLASKYTNRVWASGFYLHEDMDNKDSYNGYKYKAAGVSVGYDRAFGPLTLGAAFTYSRGDFEQKGVHDDNDIDNYGVSIYANYYHCTGFFSTLYGGYNYADNDLRTYNPMSGGWLEGDNHTNSYWIGGELGYDIKLNESWSLTPSVGVFYENHKGSGYDFGNFQSFSKIKSKAWTMPIDLELSYRAIMSDCSTLTFSVKGGYSHNFTNEGAAGVYNFIGFADAPGVMVKGVKPGKHSWNIGAGLKYEYNRFDFGIDYRYDSRKKVDAHRVAATIGISF